MAMVPVMVTAVAMGTVLPTGLGTAGGVTRLTGTLLLSSCAPRRYFRGPTTIGVVATNPSHIGTAGHGSAATALDSWPAGRAMGPIPVALVVAIQLWAEGMAMVRDTRAANQ